MRKKLDKSTKIGKWAEIGNQTGVVIPLVRKNLLAKQSEPNTHARDKIYPSEMSKDPWCLRATYYRIIGRPEPPRNESHVLTSIFAEGNAIEDKWVGWLKKDLWGDWECARCKQKFSGTTLPLEPEEKHCVYDIHFGHVLCIGELKYKQIPLYDEDLMIKGRADGAILPNTLWEMKSIGIGTFRKETPDLLKANTYKIGKKTVVDTEGMWANLKRPFLSHVKQVNLYMYMAEKMGLPFNQTSVVYEFKSNQQSKEWIIKPSSEILEPLLTGARIVVYAVEHKQAPACPRGGCKECQVYER